MLIRICRAGAIEIWLRREVRVRAEDAHRSGAGRVCKLWRSRESAFRSSRPGSVHPCTYFSCYTLQRRATTPIRRYLFFVRQRFVCLRRLRLKTTKRTVPTLRMGGRPALRENNSEHITTVLCRLPLCEMPRQHWRTMVPLTQM